MIMSISERIGFSIELRHELDRAVTWIELHRPGELPSLRGGQALAVIIPHPKSLAPKVGTVVDKESNLSYIDNEERKKLVQKAIDLNIDTPYRLEHSYSIKQLRKAIKQRNPR
jgi:hypothetical protein